MLTDNEKAQLIEFSAMVNELSLNEKDEAIIRHLLILIKSWRIKATLIKMKKEKEKIKQFQVDKGMSFSNCEKAQIRDDYAR